MKIHIFGSSAGTEPQPGRHHTAWALESSNGNIYWFDAGESCSHYAHLKGLDLLKIKAISISHPHIDHIGGLPNLFYVLQKLVTYYNRPCPDGKYQIAMLLPAMDVYDRALAMAGYCGVNLEKYFDFDLRLDRDGLMFDDGTVSIEAKHNYHMGEPEDGIFKSFSYRIKAEGKTLVFSGDVRSYRDMGEFLNGCDLLLMETGHHKSSEVCAGLRADKLDVKDILFVHSGRELLNDYENALARAEAAWGAKLRVAFDGMTVEL